MNPKPSPNSGFSDPISLQTIVYILIGICFSVLILKTLSNLLKPLFIAGFLCYFSIPLQRGLHRYKVPKYLTSLILPILVILFVSLISWIAVESIDALRVEKIPVYKEKIQVQMATAAASIKHYPKFDSFLNWALDQWQNTAGKENFFKKVLQFSLASGVTIFSLLGNLLMITIYMIFLLLEARTLSQRLYQAYGQEKSQEIQTLIQKINQGILSYIHVKTIISLLTAVLCSVIMLLFGVDLWLFWGMVIFFANFIPYIGSILAVIPPTLILFIQIGSPILQAFILSLALLGSLAAAQNVIGSFIEPRLAGRALNLSPLVVILSLAFWGWLWGIVGMILAVPILVTLKSTLEFIPPTQSFARLLGDC
jgi:predicted PurR-regulated permease PerM